MDHVMDKFVPFAVVLVLVLGSSWYNLFYLPPSVIWSRARLDLNLIRGTKNNKGKIINQIN
jgi:hypothetical protein